MTTATLFTPALIGPAIGDAFAKLDPRQLVKNPVLFTTAVVALLLTVLLFIGGTSLSLSFQVQLIVWLWLTVLFGTFAEALAEGRGRAQAASLRATKSELSARLPSGKTVPAAQLKKGDLVLVETGDLIPADGEVIEGVASVNESAITGESAPVIREAGGDRSAVTAGTRVISDRIKVRVTQEPGQGFLDRMIALVEGAERQKTPNEIALTILLVGLTIIFLIAVSTIPGFAAYAGGQVPVAILAALLITLIPTTIAALLSAIGIAGMDRLVRFNVLAKSGRAVEAAGDIDVLLLDKTGTITIGDRAASEFRPLSGVTTDELARAALLASLADETPEGRSIVALAQGRYAVEIRSLPKTAEVIPFTAQTRISGVRIGTTLIQKGAVDAVLRAHPGLGEAAAGGDLRRSAEEIARQGQTPLAVAEDGRLFGVIALKDVVKAGVRERFGELRRMGIRTVMITGDNPLTAAAIAAEAGVDDFLAGFGLVGDPVGEATTLGLAGGKTGLSDQVLPPNELVQLGGKVGAKADVERIGITMRRIDPATGDVSEASIDVADQVVTGDDLSITACRFDLRQQLLAMCHQLDRLSLQLLLLSLGILDCQRSLFDQTSFFCGCQILRQQYITQFPNLPEHFLRPSKSALENTDALRQSPENECIDRVLVDEVPHQDALGHLTDAIDTPDPLFDAHRVPRQVIVDDETAELQIHTFGSDVRADQDATVSILAESGYHGFLVEFRAAHQ